jgi:hypothetical protein
MKKYLVSAAALMLLSSGAQAATYLLSSVTYQNTFAPVPGPVAACTSCGVATAVETGGNVALNGIAWGYNGGGNAYTISFDATTTLAAGTSLNKLAGATCVDSSGTNCAPSNVIAGLAGDYFTGIGSDGTTACANNRCRVDVAIAGSDLTVIIKRALSASPTSSAAQIYTMTFAAVPVPAAVWLFGSALGLMGFARRKAA